MQSQNLKLFVELFLREAPEPMLDMVKFGISGEPPESSGRLKNNNINKAVAIALLKLRAHFPVKCFFVRAEKKNSFVKTVLNARRNAGDGQTGLLSLRVQHGVAPKQNCYRFLHLFRPLATNDCGLEVNIGSLEQIIVKLSGDEVSDSARLEGIIHRIAINAGWELADYKFDHPPAPPPTAEVQKPPPPAPHPTIDDRLLSDYLTGIGFAQWLGSEDEWITTIRAGKEWLKANPEDFYCRGMLLWSVLNKGNPSEMIEILNETVRWLGSSRPVSPKPDVQFDTRAWRQKIDRKIHQLSDDAVEHPMFVRWHVEDTLVRAALMRYLRFHAAGSQLEREFVNLGRDLEKQIVMKWLFDSTTSQRGDAWVAAAVVRINGWAGQELKSGLAWLCLLWFTGRQRQRDHMRLAIDQSCHWLEGNPNHSLVRWATLWLVGLLLPLSRSEEPIVSDLIEKSAEWLETQTAKDDRLVRMGFLWLVGACGNPTQVQRAIEQTEKWLIAHGDDDFIRVAYLLFLITRKGSAEQRRRVIAETRQWLRKHPDVYELTNIAVCLCESAPH